MDMREEAYIPTSLLTPHIPEDIQPRADNQVVDAQSRLVPQFDRCRGVGRDGTRVPHTWGGYSCRTATHIG